MPFNKISGGTNLLPALPITLNAGEFFLLPAGQGQVGQFGGISTPQLGTNNPLSGQYIVQMGQYTNLQVYDDSLNYWRGVNVTPQAMVTVSADGFNYRVVNSTGCPVGALITTAGSGLTNGFYGYQQSSSVAVTIQNGAVTTGITAITQPTASAGGSLWNCIVGGQVSGTIGFTAATTYYVNLPNWYVSGAPSVTGSPGANYTRPPIIVFTPPVNQGAQPYVLPTAYCTISAGAINAVTVTNKGAGLLGLPNITVIPAPGDTTGGGAQLGWTSTTGLQQGSGTLTALWPAYYGTAVTAVPTLTVPGSAAATAIMNFTITGFTGSAGAGYIAAGGNFNGGIVAGTSSDTNPIMEQDLSTPIFPPVSVAATTGIPSLTNGFTGVNIQAVPTFSSFSTGAAASTAQVTTVTVGGTSDTFTLISL